MNMCLSLIRFTENIIAKGLPEQTVHSIKAQNNKFKSRDLPTENTNKIVYSVGESRGRYLYRCNNYDIYS